MTVITVQSFDNNDEAGFEMENLNQDKNSEDAKIDENTNSLQPSKKFDKRISQLVLYPYREYESKELINAVFKYPLSLRLWILPSIYAACYVGMMVQKGLYWGWETTRPQNDIIFLIVSPFLVLSHYHANEWANIYYTNVSELQRKRLKESLSVWFFSCRKIDCLHSCGKCLIKFLGPCGKSLTDQIVEDYDHGFGSIMELTTEDDSHSEGGGDVDLKRHADRPWQDLDNDKQDDESSETKRPRFDTMRSYDEPAKNAKEDYKLIMEDEIEHLNKVIIALHVVQEAEKAKCWGLCESCKSERKVAKDNSVLEEDGFMGWTRFILWFNIYFTPLCTIVGTPLLGWFNHIKHSFDETNSNTKNYLMNCIIYEVLLTICVTIGFYYVSVLAAIFIEVAASVRDTIWHWKKRVFFFHKGLSHEKLIKKHAGLLLRLDAITGSFNFFVDTILFIFFFLWVLNTYYFYKEYIKGNIDRDALPWIGICCLIFLFFAVTLIYSNGFNQMILNAVRIKGWGSAYFERRPAGWKIFGLFMTHELYVKLISTQLVPFFLWIARPEQ